MRGASLLAASALIACALSVARAQPPTPSDECTTAIKACEANIDCIHRLAVLQSACVTNTCQPQCRDSALNLYQNREGRQLLRTDGSCVPGRYELEKCGWLPMRSPKHCQLAKLICETDLQCYAKWEVFISECDAEAAEGRCSQQCRGHLNATLATYHGAGLQGCTCTDKEDGRCVQLRDFTLRSCIAPDSTVLPTPPPLPSDVDTSNSVVPEFASTNQLESGASAAAAADPLDAAGEADASSASSAHSLAAVLTSAALLLIARLV